MKAARIVKPKESLEVQQLETPKPRGSQVLVKVQSSGVCHSDIHLWEGGYEGPHGPSTKGMSIITNCNRVGTLMRV